MKAETVRCKECGRYVVKDVIRQARHALKRHPEILLERLAVVVGNPKIAEEAGARVAQMFNSRFRS